MLAKVQNIKIKIKFLTKQSVTVKLVAEKLSL